MNDHIAQQDEKRILDDLSILRNLNENTEDYLFLLELQNGKSWFFGGIDQIFDVKKHGNVNRSHFWTQEWQEAIHPKDLPALNADIELLLQGKKTVHNLNYRVRNKQGQWTWVNCRGTVYNDSAEKPFFMVGRVSETTLRYRVDSLTGLFNLEQLKDDLNRNYPEELTGKFLLLGVDNLKSINILHGRTAGDSILRKIASVLEELLDIRSIYRISGDMFAVLLPGGDKATAWDFFTKVQGAVSGQFTVSCGAVNLQSLHKDIKTLQQYAEFTLEKAKKIGKNTLVFFDEVDYQQNTFSLVLLGELEESVQNGFSGFSLAYQSQVRAGNYALYGAEALLRYQSPTYGPILPDQFIPLLEDNGLIRPVGKWILKTALMQCKQWREIFPAFHISVNLSYAQLTEPDIAEQVLSILQEVGLPGDALTLEVTESMQLHNFHYYNELFSVWRNSGIIISVDDFGTGYSSLSYLKNLSISEIKVDRCFVKDIQNSSYNFQLLYNILELAANTQMRVCCEGVEELAELQVLEELKPDTLQGYLFSKPCTPEDFVQKYLDEQSPDFQKNNLQVAHVKQHRYSDLMGRRQSDILQATGIGTWLIRIIGGGARFEMYVDENMRRILGAPQNLSPEECYWHWFNRIRPDCVAYVNERVNQAIVSNEQVQLEYFWNHPERGETMVRCVGIHTEDTEGEVSVQGYHREMGSVQRISFWDEMPDTKQETEITQQMLSLEKLQEFLFDMNELVYMVDTDNYELIYMNRIALKKFGLRSIADAAGKKCYEVLRGCSSPCTFCTNSKLMKGKFYESKYFSPIFGHEYLLKVTLIEDHFRKYRVEIAVDLSEANRERQTLQSYQNIETLINNGIRSALEFSDPNDAIQYVLEYLGRLLKGERVYIFERDESNHDSNTYEWTANGVTPQKENLQNLPPEICASWYQHFENNQVLIIPEVEAIRETDPIVYETLKPQNVRSVAVVPLIENDKILGFYGIDNPPEENLEYTSSILQLIGFFIVSNLRQRKMLLQLHDLTLKDPLTGFGNRRAMYDHIAKLDPNLSVGVIYGDITGLKQLNDTVNHDAGDQLIIRSCQCLKKFFENCGLFRIGGDELLVLCSGLSEQKLAEKVALLRKELQAEKVVLSLGSAFRENLHSSSVQQMISEAEKSMYADKAEYYRTHGFDRRNPQRR